MIYIKTNWLDLIDQNFSKPHEDKFPKKMQKEKVFFIGRWKMKITRKKRNKKRGKKGE